MISFPMSGLAHEIVCEGSFRDECPGGFDEITRSPRAVVGLGFRLDVTMTPDHAQCLLDRLRGDLHTMRRDHAGNRARAVRDAIRRIERALMRES